MRGTTSPGEGERFGRYVLLECIGRGGMAEVFRAVAHGVEGFQRVFVVKRILKGKAANPEFIEMFVNEARISALLNHPNIVQIYDFGQLDGSYFLSMEYLRGKDLLSVLRQLRANNQLMPPEVAAYIGREVAKGLAYAHGLTHQGVGMNIVHRDVSPSNIMLLRAGGVKLLDFGIARAEMALEPGTAGGQALPGAVVKGKLSYVSPEQIRNEPLDGRADTFSLGVVLWECLTGKRLFHDKTDYQTMRNVLERPVPPPSTQRPDVPPALDFITVRALERQREQRYANAKIMAEDLDNFLGQSQFVAGSVPLLLDRLFGEDTNEVERVPTAPPVLDDLAVGLEARPEERRGSGSMPPVAGTGERPVPRRAPSGRRQTLVGLALAGALGVAFAAGFAVRRSPLPATGVTAPMALSPGPAAVAPPQEGARRPDMVSVRLESDPPGAEVTGPNGTVLGTTPTTALFPKGGQPLSLKLAKVGYQQATHAIIPDRDITALVTLRVLDRTGRAPNPMALGRSLMKLAGAQEQAASKAAAEAPPMPAPEEPAAPAQAFPPAEILEPEPAAAPAPKPEAEPAAPSEAPAPPSP